MKEGWTNCKIGDICSITDFVSNGSFASLRENVKYYNSPNYAVLVRLADASNGFDKSRFVYTDEHGYNFSKKSHLHGGELIMSNVGSVGSMFICPVMKQPMTLAPNTISITSQNNRFLYYYFLSDGFKVKLNGITSSTTLKKFNKTNFKLLEITIPSLSEQQAIVDYLDSAFAKIDAMKTNAEKALNEAKALFQASLKEMLEPKEGWEEYKLGDICSDIRYGTSTPSNENGEYKYLRMNNITNDGFLDVSHYKTISLPEKELEKCLVKKGDIIFNRTNSRELVGKSCVFTEDENMVIAGYLIRIRLKEGFEPQFITYNMNLQRSMGFFQHLIVGAVHQANISANNIQKVLISYPPLSEQQFIVSALDSLKSKVDKLQENYEKISQECDALKQTILRQIFE